MSVTLSGSTSLETDEITDQSQTPSVTSTNVNMPSNWNAQDSQIVYLLCELEASRSANKNLKTQLKAVQAELNNLKMTPEPGARYSPGVISAMVSEIYQAQHERDDAMMARIRLANDERDEALYRLDKIKGGKMNGCTSQGFDQTESLDEELEKSHVSSLSESDFYLNNRNEILREVAQHKKQSKESLQLTENEDDEVDGASLRTGTSSLQKSFHSPSDDTKLEPEVHLRMLQQQLCEEVRAKEEAQATCQRSKAKKDLEE